MAEFPKDAWQPGKVYEIRVSGFISSSSPKPASFTWKIPDVIHNPQATVDLTAPVTFQLDVNGSARDMAVIRRKVRKYRGNPRVYKLLAMAVPGVRFFRGAERRR